MSDIQTITEKLGNLKIARAEAQGKILSLQTEIEAKKAELGEQMVSGKTVKMTDLDALNENKTRQELVLSAIDVQLGKVERELEKAKDDEYRAELEALRDEGKRQLVEIVKTIEILFKLSAQFVGFERKANRKLQNQFGRGGLSSMGVPVADIVNKTDIWLGRASIGNRQMMDLMNEAGIMGYIDRRKYSDKEWSINAKV